MLPNVMVLRCPNCEYSSLVTEYQMDDGRKALKHIQSQLNQEKKPHKCPVCEADGRRWRECIACEGKGIVWG